jgi:RNA polymerase sigma-70 factor (ECF subfamily)
LEQTSHSDWVSTRIVAFFIQEKCMFTMTATESGSKELERLLAMIGTRKDQAAFAALYSATKGKLFSTVLLIVKRSDLAEEIIQEAYVRIWRSASSYRSLRGSPMTWMITIARNLAIDMVRKPAREIYSDDPELLELPADGLTAIEKIEASEDEQMAIQEQHNVFSALQALHPARRDLVIAAYIHGESRKQLSKRTGIPVNTIKTWIRRSLLEVESILRGKDKKRQQVINRPPQIARKNQLELGDGVICPKD